MQDRIVNILVSVVVNDEFYFTLVQKVSTIMAFWYFNQASTKEEFDGLIEKVETGEL